MDIERSKLVIWRCFKKCSQIAAEVHLTGTQSTIAFFKTMQRIYFQRDYGLISYEPNGCNFNMDKRQKFYYLSDKVLKKANQDHKKMEKKL